MEPEIPKIKTMIGNNDNKRIRFQPIVMDDYSRLILGWKL